MTLKKTKKISAAPTKPRQQVGALPYRMGTYGVEFLLVSSRETKRWIIPKGWLKKSKTAAQMALIEAYEEAGILGHISQEPIGCYQYEKKLKTGRVEACNVGVFTLHVTAQNESWPEKHERATHWCPWDEAIISVYEDGLQELMRKFAQTLMQAEDAASFV